MLLKKTKLTTQIQSASEKNTSAKKGGTPLTLRRTTNHMRRVSEKKLIEVDLQVRPLGRYVPLAADRTVEFLEGMLARAVVSSRRGHREPAPPLPLSLLEQQALQECLKLFQLKVAIQRGEIRSPERER